MIKLPQFIPENACLRCDVCCRFHGKDTVWSPFFMQEELLELVDKNIVPPSLFLSVEAERNMIAKPHLIQYGDFFHCPCFNRQENKCRIYLNRPFDCQLYPFILAKKGDSVYLAVDENCPYARNSGDIGSKQGYIEDLKDILSSGPFLESAKNNLGLVQDYGQDVTYLFPLPGLTQVIHASSARKH